MSDRHRNCKMWVITFLWSLVLNWEFFNTHHIKLFTQKDWNIKNKQFHPTPHITKKNQSSHSRWHHLLYNASCWWAGRYLMQLPQWGQMPVQYWSRCGHKKVTCREWNFFGKLTIPQSSGLLLRSTQRQPSLPSLIARTLEIYFASSHAMSLVPVVLSFSGSPLLRFTLSLWRSW